MMIQPAPDLVPQFARVLAAAREAIEGFGREIGRFEPSAMPAFLMSDALATQERAGELAHNTGSSRVRSFALDRDPAEARTRAQELARRVDARLASPRHLRETEAAMS